MDFDDFKDFCCFAAAAIVSILVLILSVCAMCYFMGSKPACEQYAKLTRAEISTQFFGASCLVKYEGRWVDYETAVNKKQEVKVTQ